MPEFQRFQSNDVAALRLSCLKTFLQSFFLGGQSGNVRQGVGVGFSINTRRVLEGSLLLTTSSKKTTIPPQCPTILQVSFLPQLPPLPISFSPSLANVLSSFIHSSIHLATKGPKFERIDKDNVVLLVVDHQVGLFQMTHDIQPDLFKNNVIGHAAIGKVFNLPTILTTSAETGWVVHQIYIDYGTDATLIN